MGIDIGGTKLQGLAMDCVGQPVSPAVRMPTGRATDAARIVSAVSAICADLHRAGHRVVGVGVGFPGSVDTRSGVARSSVMLDGWRDVPLARLIGNAVGLPCAVDNDVRAAAVAEVAELVGVGDAAAAGTIVVCAVGTGIGGALVINGTLTHGGHGIAGEIGHVVVDPRGPLCRCGRRGCVGVLASGPAIERAARLGPGGLADAFAAGQPGVRRAVERAARWLAAALADVVHLVDPDLIVIGGGVSALGPAFLGAVAEGVRANVFEDCRPVRVQAAIAGNDAGSLGAARLGWRAAGRLVGDRKCN
ncbi:MAG: ROK family protein [Deltaproteobacteria bacterium]|nr:ROK family protein [Deltaproteobacteria bacterium]